MKGLILNGEVVTGYLLGGYQKILIDGMLLHPKVTVQAGRQSGKTFIAALIATAYMCLGHRIIIALPTLKQGEEQITDTIRRMLDYLGRYERFAPALTKLIDNQKTIRLANGGGLKVLSTDETAQREGYTATLLIVDEAHNARAGVLKDLSPILNKARERGQAKIILLGIGGFRNFLLEKAKSEKGFKEILVDGPTIAESYPPYQIILDEEKETLTEEEFAQQYLLLPVNTGERYIFGDIPEELTIADNYPEPVYYFGIDIGKQRDSTIVTVISKRWDKFEVVETFSITGSDYMTQAERVKCFIDKYPFLPRNINVETNGVGSGFYDILNKKILGIQAQYITEKNKKLGIKLLQQLTINGQMCIRDEKLRKHLMGLTFSMDDNGKIEYNHSDYLSSLIVASLICYRGN